MIPIGFVLGLSVSAVTRLRVICLNSPILLNICLRSHGFGSKTTNSHGDLYQLKDRGALTLISDRLCFI